MREQPILQNAHKRAEHLTRKLNNALAQHEYVGEIRHIGLIHAIELVANKETKQAFPTEKRVGYQIYKNALSRGLLLRPLSDVLYFNPPLTITEEEIDLAVEKCVSAIEWYFKSNA